MAVKIPVPAGATERERDLLRIIERAVNTAGAVALTEGTINGVTIGATTPSSGVFTTLSISAGAVISGTYTPDLFNVTNVAASTPYACQYLRVGNVVNVSGKVDVDPTLAAATVLGISLPIASTISAAEKCSGVAAASSIASEVAAVTGDTVNNRAQLEWVTVSVVNHAMSFDFTYLVT